jgi:tetratricopeptide (TPR) repeat protein
MSFDKTKVMRAAEKYLAQGKIQAAIKEYLQIADKDSNDFAVLNVLGDLYVRTGKNKEAMACFERIAEHYHDEGFSLKAIAMFKKIDRLNPGTPEIAKKLAALYEAQGLMVDARAQYMTVVDAYARAGQADRALEVLQKVADLDPNNVELRLKLGEGYLKERANAKAADAFAKAGTQFLARGNSDRALDSHTRALHIDPHNRAALSGLVSAHLQRGTPEEAAELLEEAVSSEPEDTELLAMLAEAHLQAEDAPAAERVVALLVTKQASNYARFTDVVHLYLKQGDTESAVRLLASVTEQMLSGREEPQLLTLVNEILSRDPEQIMGLRLLVRVYWWQRDMEKLRVALERLVDAAEAANLVEEEKAALTQLVQLVPDRSQYVERLRALGGQEPAAEPSRPVFQPAEGEVPTFESFTLVREESDANGLEAGALVEPTATFEANAAATEGQDPASSFADLNAWTDTSASGASSGSGTAAPAAFQEFDFDVASSEPASSAGSVAGGDPRREEIWRGELESVDFYIAQGYKDIALDTLAMLEKQFGPNAEIDLRRSQLNAGASDAAAPAAAPAEAVDFSSLVSYDAGETGEPPAASQNGAFNLDVNMSMPLEGVPAPVPARPGKGIDPGLAAIFEEFRIAAEEEEEPSPSDNDYETHYNLGLAYKEMDLLDEAVEEFQIAAGLVAPEDGTPRYLHCCNLLGHCFMQKNLARAAVMWFQKGLAAKGHTQDEYQALRYELGAAYEQMGDLDHAIEVFTEVYGTDVSYRGVAEKLRNLQAQRTSK